MRLSHPFRTSIIILAASLSMMGCKKSQSPGTESPVDANAIRIGEVGSMTGPQASFGTSTHQGIVLAIQEINAAGGVKGRKLELISLDDQSKPEEAATAVTKLITQDKVDFLFSPFGSGAAKAASTVSEKYQVPTVAATASSRITMRGSSASARAMFTRWRCPPDNSCG